MKTLALKRLCKTLGLADCARCDFSSKIERKKIMCTWQKEKGDGLQQCEKIKDCDHWIDYSSVEKGIKKILKNLETEIKEILNGIID